VIEADCPECRLTSPRAAVRGAAVSTLGAFVLHPKLESPPVPGWLVLAPRRHVTQWDALDAGELRELGPLVARVMAALRSETPAAKVYVSVFAEVLPHFHVHIVARPPDLAPEKRGAFVFLTEGAPVETESAAIYKRVAARLTAAPPRSPWPAVLLSALVWPGAGQMKNGERLKGAVFGLASLALLAVFAWRVTTDATSVLLQAQGPMGPLELWSLAEEIRSRNSGALGGLTTVLMLLWGGSVLDAWHGATRKARGR
jgi:diadenosine tetraphosphate (Ap4A) HIT family hydrolase